MTLFHHNPPTQKALQRSLFVNRKREMSHLKKQIPGDFGDACIQVIHGSSRVGKSHLALNYLSDLEDTGLYHIFIVKAAGGRTARQILVDLYHETRNRLLAVETPADLPANPTEQQLEGVSSRGILEEAREIIRVFDGLVSGTEQNREVTFSETFQHTESFKWVANLLGLSSELAGATVWGETKLKKVVLAAPSDSLLVDLLRELCEVLEITTLKQCIIYVDDIDLLDVGPFIAQEEVAVLTRLLHRLAESPQICVVASMRTRHLTIGQKEMKEALRVRPMKEGYMEEVYQRHIETFNEGRKIFEDECLAKQMEFADGHIGNFLRQCSKISDWGGLEGRTDDSRLLSVTDLRDFIRDEIRDVARNPDLRSYLDEIRTAALNRRQEVALDPGVLGTQLMYTLLMESLDGGTPKMYAIRPLVADVLYETGKDAKNDTV